MFKKLIILLLVTSCFSACNSYTNEDGDKVYVPKLSTIIYDSCEYVIGVDNYRGLLAHKGNCKYCKQRREEEKNVDEFKQHVKNILMELDNQ
jgi:thioredoxin-related protein